MLIVKPYKDGAPLQDILVDGWSRDFHFLQTLWEVNVSGYEVSQSELLDYWHKLDLWMQAGFENEQAGLKAPRMPQFATFH